MGIFSFFSRPVKKAKGSYCNSDSFVHLDYIEGDDIEDEVFTSQDRGDSVDFSSDGFEDEAVNNRHYEDGRPVEHGPEKKKHADSTTEYYYYEDADYK
ncbi:MAG: hypothetical protein AAFQ63_12170 [Cyanobacteria bacterium J06621_11]